MKLFYLIIVIFLVETGLAQSQHDLDPYYRPPLAPQHPPPPPPCHCHPCGVDRAVIALAVIVGLFFIIIIGLLIIVYKLKNKTYSENGQQSQGTAVKLSNANKYSIQNEGNQSHDATYTRQLSNEDPRTKLKRQGSKMSVVQFPDQRDPLDNNIDKIKEDEPSSAVSTIKKKVCIAPKHYVERETMDAVIQAVLAKSKEKNESSSLSNLESILHEENTTNTVETNSVEKSASTSILDSDWSDKPISVKSMINNFEVSLSPKPIRKNDKKESNNENKRYRPFALPGMIAAKSTDALIVDDMDDSPLADNGPISTNIHSNDETDDIYIDTPSNIPVSLTNDVHQDEVYDNPLNNKSIILANNETVEDIYHGVPTDIRPVSGLIENPEFVDNIYDDVRRESASKSGAINLEKKTQKDEYLVPVSALDDYNFKLDYVNARSFNI